MTNEPEVLIFPTPSDAAHVAAERIATALATAVAARGVAHWVTTGGSTPGPIYQHLAEMPYRESVPSPRATKRASALPAWRSMRPGSRGSMSCSSASAPTATSSRSSRDPRHGTTRDGSRRSPRRPTSRRMSPGSRSIRGS
ncbi:MAG: 6-phosphogluconolactonase [Chloroflexi bacterium]|nr:6-phosphogluconolactonase [Chloroflexota bacterium]